MSDSYGCVCFFCGERYYSDSDTRIMVKRVERDGNTRKTIKWDGVVCDSCIERYFTRAVNQ